MKSFTIKNLVIITLISLTSLVISAQPTANTDLSKSYLIGPGDIISVKVMGEPEFSFVRSIDDDGSLLVQMDTDVRVPAQCKTETQLKTDVAKLMSKYLRSPMISVAVTERKSHPLTSVTGEVRKPGGIMLVRQTHLRELLSFVEGTTEDAGGMVQVFRTKNPMCPGMGDPTAVTGDVPYKLYSLSAVNSGSDDANPLVYPGDMIVVQKASPVYVTGEVRAPQGIRLAETGTSLSQAIAMVGGMTHEAKTTSVKVYRVKEGEAANRDVLTADLKLIKEGKQKDIMLEPYDIVEVDKAKDSIAMAILKIAVGVGKSGLTSMTNGIGYRVMY